MPLVSGQDVLCSIVLRYNRHRVTTETKYRLLPTDGVRSHRSDAIIRRLLGGSCRSLPESRDEEPMWLPLFRSSSDFKLINLNRVVLHDAFTANAQSNGFPRKLHKNGTIEFVHGDTRLARMSLCTQKYSLYLRSRFVTEAIISMTKHDVLTHIKNDNKNIYTVL